MMKRDRGETADRDGTEVQQRRLGPRHQRNTGWRGSASGRKGEEFGGGGGGESFHQDPSFLSMEFDIQKEMVGAVIGKGGGTARSIRSRTGASVHVHSPQTENARTFVELRGRREQIESAFEELRAVVASVDEEFAKQMHASVSLKTKPESVGCLIGKQGQNIKQIEEETRARVRVEPHEEGEEFQCVYVSGDVAAVELATQMVQESLDRYDATRAKKQFPPHMPRLQGQSQKVTEQKTILPEEHNLPQPDTETTVPPILIQAPAGGFGTQPAILVLQADGTYHAAQLVTAVDGGFNPAGLVSIVNPQTATAPAAVQTYLPHQSQPLDVAPQQHLQTAVYPQPQHLIQQHAAPALMHQPQQQVTSIPMTQAAAASPAASALNYQQFPPQLYSFATASGAMAPMGSAIGLTAAGVEQAQQPTTSIPHGLSAVAPSSNYPPAAP